VISAVLSIRLNNDFSVDMLSWILAAIGIA
jgi:hypothetical protein